MSRILVAKVLAHLSGILSRFQTNQVSYRVVSWDPLRTEPSVTVKVPCRASMRLLKLSMRLGGSHWDHFALDHSDCETVKCRRCGGCLCLS